MDNTSDAIATEVDKYLTDCSSELGSLDCYPHIKQLYVLLNTGLPASAAVERLFSLGGRVFSPLRSRLSAEHFEMMVFFCAFRNGDVRLWTSLESVCDCDIDCIRNLLVKLLMMTCETSNIVFTCVVCRPSYHRVLQYYCNTIAILHWQLVLQLVLQYFLHQLLLLLLQYFFSVLLTTLLDTTRSTVWTSVYAFFWHLRTCHQLNLQCVQKKHPRSFSCLTLKKIDQF